MMPLLGALKRALLPLLALLIAAAAIWLEWSVGWVLFPLIVCLPIILLGWPWALTPAVFAATFAVALIYNELHRKGKTLLETAVVFPVLLAY